MQADFLLRAAPQSPRLLLAVSLGAPAAPHLNARFFFLAVVGGAGDAAAAVPWDAPVDVAGSPACWPDVLAAAAAFAVADGSLAAAAADLACLGVPHALSMQQGGMAELLLGGGHAASLGRHGQMVLRGGSASMGGGTPIVVGAEGEEA